MRILITGATGFVGRALTQQLLSNGHEIVATSRHPSQAKNILGADVQCQKTPENPEDYRRLLENMDTLILLQGESVASRWTQKKKESMRSSRVHATKAWINALEQLPQEKRPKNLLSASAVGFYGNTQNASVNETAPAGTGFLAELCKDWENAAKQAENLGLRVCIFRIGVVLGLEGGALDKLLPIFSLGLGGPIAPGTQGFPWIHLVDLVQIFMHCLKDQTIKGIFNAVAPDIKSNKEFSTELGKFLHRPTTFTVPEFAIKTIFGEGAQVLTEGQRVIPQKLQELGFRFQFPTLSLAFEDLISNVKEPHFSKISHLKQNLPTSDYAQKNHPTKILEQTVTLDAPISEVFHFFSKARNLGPMTPPSMAFEFKTPDPISVHPGAQIDYLIRIGKIPMKWKTEIELFDEGKQFVDVQKKGPYACWWHEHRFIPQGDKTEMRDRVLYRVPFGPLGEIAHSLFVKPMLRRVFKYRTHMMRFRFPG